MAKEKSVKVSIQPLADRVLVRRVEKEAKKSAAGIIIPDTAEKEKSKMGIVEAVGPGRANDEGDVTPVAVKVGAKVIFNAGWDNEVEIDGDDNDYFLVKESDILAVIK